MSVKKPFNPFYPLLVLAGAAFAVTAFAYGYMAFQSVNSVRSDADKHAAHALFQWLRTHGDAALLLELAVLAACTVGVMAVDSRQRVEPRDADEAEQTVRP